MTILIGKLSGSLLVAVLGTVTYIIGFNYYMSSLLGNQSQMDLSSLGLTTTPMSYALLGLVLFISIVASLAIAVAFSVFSEDVRSAQTSVSYIYVVILIPTFLFMFIDINTLSLPIQLLLYTIPFTHTLAATKEILIGNFSGIFLNVVYLIIFTVVILYIAAKLFTTEKVFTSRFMIRRKVRTE
jgi:ABC-2 type transport system permease protein